MKALIIDDERSIREGLAKTLKRMGHEIDMQQTMGSMIQRSLRKITAKVMIRKKSTPREKTIRSFLIKEIMSAMIMGTPPRKSPAWWRCSSIISRILSTV